MILFVQGEPRCGKSLLVERYLASLGQNVLYVGLLPARPEYYEVIAAHQKRRPASWGLLEPNNDLATDYRTMLRTSRRYDAVLIDGLTVYLRRLIFLGMVNSQNIHTGLRIIRRLQMAQKPYYILDIPASNEAMPEIKQIHRWLTACAAAVHTVKQGVATPPLAGKGNDYE